MCYRRSVDFLRVEFLTFPCIALFPKEPAKICTTTANEIAAKINKMIIQGLCVAYQLMISSDCQKIYAYESPVAWCSGYCHKKLLYIIMCLRVLHVLNNPCNKNIFVEPSTILNHEQKSVFNQNKGWIFNQTRDTRNTSNQLMKANSPWTKLPPIIVELFFRTRQNEYHEQINK